LFDFEKYFHRESKIVIKTTGKVVRVKCINEEKELVVAKQTG